ncbi:MAG TPA: TraR/DksA C4-type zinc finger protein [Thermoguttaceae bacterium]|nr:TraR/DksA C4-type zinc finger protein [Thermoguttaceae bacterium]
MKNEDLKLYKERLLGLRARLRGDADQMGGPIFERPPAQASGDLSFTPLHMADVGSENFEREFTLSLIEAKDRTLDQIEEALQRVEDGTYGMCEECDKKIPKARLGAIPYATLCITCAAGLESD